MSTFVADHLPDALLSRLALDRAIDHADRAIIICTVDEHGWPHPAMVSTLELVARDARNLRLAIHAGSRTTRNLEVNGLMTVIVADEEGVSYIKGYVLMRAALMAAAPHLASFNMRVDRVLEDKPTEPEHARLAAGLRITRTAIDLPHARAVLTELAGDAS